MAYSFTSDSVYEDMIDNQCYLESVNNKHIEFNGDEKCLLIKKLQKLSEKLIAHTG